MPYDSTDDASAGGIEAKMLSAYRAAHPGSETPSKKVLSDFIARDFRAIMARLDIGIAESHAHLDRIFSTLATGPS
jgi:hypothetical protein